jgi:hypothetical protein
MGARKTGKSTFLKLNFPDSLVYDFLKTEVMLELTKRPSLLREQLLAADPKLLKKPIILDEVQNMRDFLLPGSALHRKPPGFSAPICCRAPSAAFYLRLPDP